MTTSVFIAEASPASPDREDEFNDWYTTTHIPEVRSAIPEVTAVSRYRTWKADQDGPARYIAVYEVDGLSAAEAAAKLGAAVPTFTAGPMITEGEHASVLTFADSAGAN
ncbi:hypothetical protein [Microbacterium soli]|uniref:EthD family reductase n=1 Tax=Microbacterium soli TaxID=446075 RepID=A0ABP7NI88_9MICO